jgi:bifunctional UDP-N-acetylglucosamine pyrophosphorylase/glucosamine-1-phosphate N-acetyltransferase
VVRVGKDDRVLRIVEEVDAAPDEIEIDEINTGIFCFRRSLLSPALRRLAPDNAQGELYLTDTVEVLADAGHKVVGVLVDDPAETQGVNDRVQLAAAEADLRARTNRAWQAQGVTMVDPASTYLDAQVTLAADVTIFPGTILQGRTTIGAGVEIGPGCRLVDCKVGEHTTLEHTVARLSVIGADCAVGPYAVLEPGTNLASGTRTGPFYTAGTAGPGD